MIAIVPKKFRGRIVRAAIVGMVMSVWTGTKQPKLTTTAASINHCAAIRIVEMTPSSQIISTKFECNELSNTFMLQPHSIAALLEVADVQDTSERMHLTVSDGSALLIADMDSLPEWWPEIEKPQPQDAAGADCLFLPQKRGRKRPHTRGHKGKIQIR